MHVIAGSQSRAGVPVSPELCLPGGDGGGHGAAGHRLPCGAGQDPVTDECSGVQ